MAADASPEPARLPVRELLPAGNGWRRAAAIATASAAVAIAHVVQRYWPGLAGEPVTRQLAFLKVMLLVPVLLSIEWVRDVRFPADRPGRHESEC